MSWCKEPTPSLHDCLHHCTLLSLAHDRHYPPWRGKQPDCILQQQNLFKLPSRDVKAASCLWKLSTESGAFKDAERCDRETVYVLMKWSARSWGKIGNGCSPVDRRNSHLGSGYTGYTGWWSEEPKGRGDCKPGNKGIGPSLLIFPQLVSTHSVWRSWNFDNNNLNILHYALICCEARQCRHPITCLNFRLHDSISSHHTPGVTLTFTSCSRT